MRFLRAQGLHSPRCLSRMTAGPVSASPNFLHIELSRRLSTRAQNEFQVPVAPETPTTLHGQPSLHLVDGNDLLLQFAPSSLHVLPGPLDTDRFKSALSQTLGLFPHAAGRLRQSADNWRIDLTNSPIPVTIASSDSEHVVSPSNARYVVQPSPHIAPYVVPVDLLGAMRGEDAPLVSFKLTTMGGGQTVVGNSWNHVLGDGATLTHFMHTLSAIYADLKPIPPPPVFHKRTYEPLSSPLSAADLSLVRRFAPQVEQSYPLQEVMARYETEAQETGIVDLLFEAEEMEAIWESAQGENGTTTSTRVTRQDALSAYLITLHNRCLEKPIDMAMNLMNIRLRDIPLNEDGLYRHPNVAGNCTLIAHASLLSSSSEPIPHRSLPSIALAIRRTTLAARDPAFVATYLRVNSARYVEGVKEGRFYMYPREGAVLVNSLMGVDRNRLASFGYEGRSQFYTDTSWERMFRVHPANPVRRISESSGRKEAAWDTGVGAFVVSFRVRHDLMEKMMTMKQSDMHDLRIGREFTC